MVVDGTKAINVNVGTRNIIIVDEGVIDVVGVIIVVVVADFGEVVNVVGVIVVEVDKANSKVNGIDFNVGVAIVEVEEEISNLSVTVTVTGTGIDVVIIIDVVDKAFFRFIRNRSRCSP